jgi:hypothetical protein
MYLADSADVVVGDVPSPGGYGIPLLDLDLHLENCSCMNIEIASQKDLSENKLLLSSLRRKKESSSRLDLVVGGCLHRVVVAVKRFSRAGFLSGRAASHQM